MPPERLHDEQSPGRRLPSAELRRTKWWTGPTPEKDMAVVSPEELEQRVALLLVRDAASSHGGYQRPVRA